MQPCSDTVFNAARVAATSLPPCRRGRERQAGLGIPDADHQRWHTGAAAFVAAPQALAVHRDHARRRTEAETFAQGPTKRQGLVQVVGVEQAEQPAEVSWLGVASAGRSTMSASLHAVRRSEIGDVDADSAPHNVAASARNSSAGRSCRALKSRGIANFTENRNAVFPSRLSRIRKDPLQESTLSSSAIALYSCAIPLPRKGGGLGRGHACSIFS